MTIIPMPPVHQGYSTARYVLRNHAIHDLEAIDAAFDVLAHSQDPADRALLLYSHPDYDVALRWERDYFNRLLQQ